MRRGEDEERESREILPIEDTFKIIYVERIKKFLDTVFPFYLSLHADI